MGTTHWMVVVASGMGVIALAWWLWKQPHPENGVSSDQRDTHELGDPPSPGEGLAGPGAESQRPDARPSGGEGYPKTQGPEQ